MRISHHVRVVTRTGNPVQTTYQGRVGGADSVCMMISDEQARQAAKYLRSPAHSHPAQPMRDVPQTVIDEAVVRASRAPETRADRILMARRHLEAGEFDAHAIAEKMLQRMLGDSLR